MSSTAPPPGNGNTPPGSTGATPWTLPIPPDPSWTPPRLEIPQAFRRPPLQLLPAPPARDWSILHQHYPESLVERLTECRWHYWHRQFANPIAGDMGDEALPNGCGDRTRCGWCALSYSGNQADEQFEVFWLVHRSTGASMFTVEVELPGAALTQWAPRAAARGCLRAQARGGLCRGTCISCGSALTWWGQARGIEGSFVTRVIDTIRRLLPGTGGVRISSCAECTHPFVPRYAVTAHIPLIALAASGETKLISPPDTSAFAANLNKRTIPAGLGQVTGVTATVANNSANIAKEVWASNIPLLAHAVREIRGAYVPIPDEVHATVARLTLPGPSGRRHRRRSWFGNFSNGAGLEQALRAMHIHPIPEGPGTPKKIVDKLRPFARSGSSISVQSLWSGIESVVPAAWFAPEPLLNNRGFVIARVRRPRWEYRGP